MKRALIIRVGVVVLLLAIIVSLGAPVWAAETRTGDTIVIPAGTTIEDNLYAGGNNITVDGRITGDLIAGAANVTINGTVDGNVFVGSQTLVVNGTVNGDIAAGTQVLQLGPNAVVSRNVLNFGFSLETQQGSSVKGDVLFYGSQALIAGTVDRDVQGGMNGFELRGNVGGNVDVQVGDSSSGADAGKYVPASVGIPSVGAGLRLADGATIGGRLTYEAPRDGDINAGAKVTGPVLRKPSTSGNTQGFTWFASTAAEGFSLRAQIERFVTLLLVGLLLIWLFPRWTKRLGDTVMGAPLPTLGRGLLMCLLFVLLLILVPIATVLLALLFGVLTLGGLAVWSAILGIFSEIGIIVAFVVFAGYIAEAIVSLVLGKWLLSRIQPSLAEGNILPLIVGLVIFVVVTAIPILGGLIGLLAILFGLGALWRWMRPARPSAPGPMSSSMVTPAAS